MFEDLNTVVMHLVNIVMHLSPYGVFFLMAKLFTTLQLDDMANLGKYFSCSAFCVVFPWFYRLWIVYQTGRRFKPSDVLP